MLHHCELILRHVLKLVEMLWISQTYCQCKKYLIWNWKFAHIVQLWQFHSSSLIFTRELKYGEKNILLFKTKSCQNVSSEKNIYVYFISVFPDQKKILNHLVSSCEEGDANQGCGFYWGFFSPHQDWVSDQTDVLSLLFVLFPVQLNPGRWGGQRATPSTFLLKYLDSLEHWNHRASFVGSSSKDLCSVLFNILFPWEGKIPVHCTS